MARWTITTLRDQPVIEYRWFGRWLTPNWIDRRQIRRRDRRTDRLPARLLDGFSDWLRTWAIAMVDVDE